MNKYNTAQYLPLVEALRDGELQVKWNENTKWIDCKDCDFTAPHQHYRRRPKRRTVPLEQGDLPFPCAVKLPNNTTYSLVLQFLDGGVYLANGYRSFSILLEEGWLYSPTPNDPNSWRRCEKEVEE